MFASSFRELIVYFLDLVIKKPASCAGFCVSVVVFFFHSLPARLVHDKEQAQE
ncbi:hypothetical protein L911_2190 [Vibrio fluvialis I21563]|uniref:Uncharacterized protein n=1 Tax=Vibrio fluvialis PG41 TaxID=1336752 RepID=S7HVM0_VIBFL|nr:hypothetical protein L910_2673 [Vibrio fluvialis PG41]EPP22772.1 hypothetical protein L911_2190 [Vibrio fluvialis I21563]